MYYYKIFKTRQKFIYLILFVLASIYLIFLASYQLRSLKLNVGIPKGYDTLGHISQIEFVKKNFPNIFWNPYWYLGSVSFPSGYPPLYHNSLGIIAKFSGISSADLVRNSSNLSMIVILMSLFGIAYISSSSFLLALAVPLLLMITPAFWTFILQFGLHIRIAGIAMYSLHVLSILAYFKYKNRTILYLFVVTSFTAVILTHLFIGLLAFLTFSFLIFNFEEQGRKLAVWVWTILLSFGIGAFYFIPYLVERPIRIPFIGITTDPVYQPIKFELLYQLKYPGFGIIPLLVLALLIIILVMGWDKRKIVFDFKNSKLLNECFYFFAILGLFFIIYGLGIFKFYLSGVYRSQAPFFAVIFLGFAVIFGASNFKRQIIMETLLFAAVAILTFLVLNFYKNSGIRVANNSLTTIDRINLVNIDESKNYRLAHYEDRIGAAFNLKYDGLQTRGYFAPAIIFPGFHYWFEENVFKQNNNSVSKYFSDWYAIDQIYTGRGMDSENYSRAGNIYLYNFKTPIFLATDAPYVFIDSSESEYEQVIKEVAMNGLLTDRVIPLFNPSWRKDKMTVSNYSEMEKLLDLSKSEGYATSGQSLKAIYVNPSHWEVVLDKKYHGLVFKQSFFRNWHAKLVEETGKNKNLKIFMAGPGMMYVMLPLEFGLPAKVIFEYKVSLFYYLGAIVSVGTLLFAIYITFFKKIESRDKRLTKL